MRLISKFSGGGGDLACPGLPEPLQLELQGDRKLLKTPNWRDFAQPSNRVCDAGPGPRSVNSAADWSTPDEHLLFRRAPRRYRHCDVIKLPIAVSLFAGRSLPGNSDLILHLCRDIDIIFYVCIYCHFLHAVWCLDAAVVGFHL